MTQEFTDHIDGLIESVRELKATLDELEHKLDEMSGSVSTDK
jgi:hypothetical protein